MHSDGLKNSELSSILCFPISGDHSWLLVLRIDTQHTEVLGPKRK